MEYYVSLHNKNTASYTCLHRFLTINLHIDWTTAVSLEKRKQVTNKVTKCSCHWYRIENNLFSRNIVLIYEQLVLQTVGIDFTGIKGKIYDE